MYSRKRNKTKKYIYSGFVLVLCLLVLGVAWPFSEAQESDTATVDNVSSKNEEYVDSDTAANEDSSLTGTENTDSENTDENNQDESIMESAEAYYLVKRNGDRITVYYCVGEQSIELETTGIVYDVLGPDDQKLFDEGIKVSSQEELGVLLQDFES